MLKIAKKMQKRTIFPNLKSLFASICVFLRNFAPEFANSKWKKTNSK